MLVLTVRRQLSETTDFEIDPLACTSLLRVDGHVKTSILDVSLDDLCDQVRESQLPQPRPKQYWRSWLCPYPSHEAL